MGILQFLSYFFEPKSTSSDSNNNNNNQKEIQTQKAQVNVYAKDTSLDKFREELKTMNAVISRASKLIDAKLPYTRLRSVQQLSLKEDLLTPTGKEKKIPYTLIFQIDNNQTGTIRLFKDKTIASIKVTTWRKDEGWTIKTNNDGSLTINTIDYINMATDARRKRLYDLNPKPKRKTVRKDSGKKYKPTEIDIMQHRSASKEYIKAINERFYNDYPIKPFISLDREKNTNWIEKAAMFGASPHVLNMTPFKDGYLSGHIYMLHWLTKFNPEFRRVPSYFEYEYGIDFFKELKLLIEMNLIDSTYHVTKRGYDLIEKHKGVIKDHI